MPFSWIYRRFARKYTFTSYYLYMSTYYILKHFSAINLTLWHYIIGSRLLVKLIFGMCIGSSQKNKTIKNQAKKHRRREKYRSWTTFTIKKSGTMWISRRYLKKICIMFIYIHKKYIFYTFIKIIVRVISRRLEQSDLLSTLIHCKTTSIFILPPSSTGHCSTRLFSSCPFYLVTPNDNYSFTNGFYN